MDVRADGHRHDNALLRHFFEAHWNRRADGFAHAFVPRFESGRVSLVLHASSIDPGANSGISVAHCVGWRSFDGR